MISKKNLKLESVKDNTGLYWRCQLHVFLPKRWYLYTNTVIIKVIICINNTHRWTCTQIYSIFSFFLSSFYEVDVWTEQWHLCLDSVVKSENAIKPAGCVSVLWDRASGVQRSAPLQLDKKHVAHDDNSSRITSPLSDLSLSLVWGLTPCVSFRPTSSVWNLPRPLNMNTETDASPVTGGRTRGEPTFKSGFFLGGDHTLLSYFLSFPVNLTGKRHCLSQASKTKT